MPKLRQIFLILQNFMCKDIFGVIKKWRVRKKLSSQKIAMKCMRLIVDLEKQKILAV